jgi:trans-aconitate 2-methyltransferase
MEWSATQYRKFESERTRAAYDLLQGVPPLDVRRVVDLGCGPGNTTELLVARYPDAQVSGVDSSADMVAQARHRLPGVDFVQADLSQWASGQPVDLLFANAVFQWVPDHRQLLPALFRSVAPGGVFAFQLPDNLNQPSHTAMRYAAREIGLGDRLRAAEATRTPIAEPAMYYDLLIGDAARIDIWHTIYFHSLTDADAIVEWFLGSGLRPYLALLTPEERPRFLAAYRAAIATAYPPRSDGRVLLPFPRLFVVAQRM